MHFATATGKGCYALTAAEILQARRPAVSDSRNMSGRGGGCDMFGEGVLSVVKGELL